MKVLVVEDNALVRFVIVAALRRRDPTLEISEAASVAEGYREALRSRPVLLLSDIDLPDGNGLDLARRLKAELPGLRVIVDTASDRPEYRAAAADLGADGFVRKDLLEDQEFLDSLADAVLLIGQGAAQPLLGVTAERQVA